MDILVSDVRKYRYNYFSSLLSGDFKKLYKQKCNDVFERKGRELGIWGYWRKNNYWGIVEFYGDFVTQWCWRNTINTHPYCFHDLYYLFYDSTGIELDFNDRSSWQENIDILFEFIEKNFELYFTTNIETKYYYHFWFRCNKSWTLGQITIISLMYKIRKIFEEYKIVNMDFALKRGDANDFKGIDVIITTQTKDVHQRRNKIKIQVKSGKIVSEDDTGCIMTGSANDLRAEVDYWCYVDITENGTNIILFQNLNRYISRVGENILFKKEIIHPIRIKEKIMISEKLQEIATYCFQRKILIDIEYLNGDVNKVSIQTKPEKMINIIISDFKDENLYKLLDDKFIELQQLFN